MRKPLIMGILNVTPDSFYDGGRYLDAMTAAGRAMEMIGEGADIIDIGGESTGPGSREISVKEELNRIMPVMEKIGSANNADISVDTYKSEVARKALAAGACMINDVTAGRSDPDMFGLIADAGCKYVMMHSKDNSPRTTVRYIEYEYVIHRIYVFFEERLALAEKSGIRRDQIILDPGLGHFVSGNPKFSWEILENLEVVKKLGCPVLVSPSRKSFTGKTLNGTLKATKIAVKHGADIIRTHDVGETKEMDI